jgi:hypothetical protein
MQDLEPFFTYHRADEIAFGTIKLFKIHDMYVRL